MFKVDKAIAVIWNRIANWQHATFYAGENRSRIGDGKGALAKLKEEVDELTENPSADEWADVQFVLIDVANQLGIDPTMALNAKLKVNVMRKWPDKPAEDGTFSHTEEAPGRE